MEIVDFKQAMLDKLAECEAWLVGYDEAVARAKEAEDKYLAAKEEVDAYTPENIAKIEAYRDTLKADLGIKDEEECEPVNETQNIV